ncbi:PilN domain-containing protein [uncultured Pseudomonas sp.]|uniref:PilN domain-containing protein n=1 Tax=uncultured Pseudomonas sp. TaxID=114707 RepID=UPI00258A8BCB|nr:PilN domain-containing protein [uncultured Pseudomonas sp.]
MNLRLNLLPWRERQRLVALRNFQLVFLGSLFAAFVVVMLVDRFAHLRLKQQAAAGVQRQQQLQWLDGQVACLEQLREAHAGLRSQVDALGGLRSSQHGVPQLLIEIELAMPQGMQLTRLDVQGDRLQVNGLAVSAAVLAQFMRDLQRSPVLLDLELKHVIARAGGDAFLLVARVVAS